MQHRTRDVLIRQRTQIINALRAHLAELGLVAAQATPSHVNLSGIAVDGGGPELLGVTQLCLRARIIQFQLPLGQPPRGEKCETVSSVRRIDMCKSTIALTLSLLTTSMLPPAVMAQSAPSAITEAEAQSIARRCLCVFLLAGHDGRDATSSSPTSSRARSRAKVR